MSQFLYNQLSKKKVKYDEKLVRRSIVVVRNTSSKKTLDKHKVFLYNSLSTIILKNVNNFFNLIKDVEEAYVIHERDDIVIECYMILDKCIENYNLRLIDKKFFFYFNRSLSVGLYRIYQKQYKKEVFNKSNFDNISSFDKRTFTENNSYPLLLNKNFTDREILLMQSKVDEEKIGDFCKKMEITRNEYYKLLTNIRKKLERNFLS